MGDTIKLERREPSQHCMAATAPTMSSSSSLVSCPKCSSQFVGAVGGACVECGTALQQPATGDDSQRSIGDANLEYHLGAMADSIGSGLEELRTRLESADAMNDMTVGQLKSMIRYFRRTVAGCKLELTGNKQSFIKSILESLNTLRSVHGPPSSAILMGASVDSIDFIAVVVECPRPSCTAQQQILREHCNPQNRFACTKCSKVFFVDFEGFTVAPEQAASSS